RVSPPPETKHVEEIEYDARQPNRDALELLGEPTVRRRIVERAVTEGLRRSPDRHGRRLQLVGRVRNEVSTHRVEPPCLGHIANDHEYRSSVADRLRAGEQPACRGTGFHLDGVRRTRVPGAPSGASDLGGEELVEGGG